MQAKVKVLKSRLEDVRKEINTNGCRVADYKKVWHEAATKIDKSIEIVRMVLHYSQYDKELTKHFLWDQKPKSFYTFVCSQSGKRTSWPCYDALSAGKRWTTGIFITRNLEIPEAFKGYAKDLIIAQNKIIKKRREEMLCGNEKPDP